MKGGEKKQRWNAICVTIQVIHRRVSSDKKRIMQRFARFDWMFIELRGFEMLPA
jgi:hypothetical protein